MLRLTSRPKKIIAKEMLSISKEGLSSYDYSCLVQDNTISNDKDFHSFLTTMDTKDKAIVFICSMKSKHRQLLDAIEILSKETPKYFFVLPKD